MPISKTFNLDLFFDNFNTSWIINSVSGLGIKTPSVILNSFFQKSFFPNKYAIGLAHQKVLHLLSMYEGISISELLKKLKITKQSLNRVLKDLIKLDAIIFEKDDQDTRIKHIFLNKKGRQIFNEIFEIQKKRIYAALLNSSSEEVINFDNVLKKIING